MVTTLTDVKWLSDVQSSKLCLTSDRLALLLSGGDAS